MRVRVYNIGNVGKLKISTSYYSTRTIYMWHKNNKNIISSFFLPKSNI